MNRTLNSLLLAAALAGFCTVAWAASQTQEASAPTTQKAVPLTVDEIVHRTNYASYYQGRDGRALVRMTITDSQGRKRHLELTILRWDKPKDLAKEDSKDPKVAALADLGNTGDQKFYVFFHQPADVNKTVFLVHKHLNKPDDRWLYMPGLDLVKRVSSADKRASFVGSHFFYEDVSGRNIAEDTHELTETTDNYYVLKNTPKAPDNVEFGYYVMHIYKPTFQVFRIDYFDKQGKLYRQYKVLAVENKRYGYPTVAKASMTDLRDKSHTLAEYTQVKYDIDVPESIFTERYLRLPPQEHLKWRGSRPGTGQ